MDHSPEIQPTTPTPPLLPASRPATTAPVTTASPTLSRQDLAEWAREELLEAGSQMLADIHDIDFHNYGDGSQTPFDYTLQYAGTDRLAAEVLAMADRIAQVAADTQAAATAAVARRAWLLSGAPLRCALCGDDIDAELEPWQVCTDLAEHLVCHQRATEPRDSREGLARPSEAEQRTHILAEDQYAAYCHDQLRSTGAVLGNEVVLTGPNDEERYQTWTTEFASSVSAGGGISWDGHIAHITVNGVRHTLAIVDTWTDEDSVRNGDGQDDEQAADGREPTS